MSKKSFVYLFVTILLIGIVFLVGYFSSLTHRLSNGVLESNSDPVVSTQSSQGRLVSNNEDMFNAALKDSTFSRYKPKDVQIILTDEQQPLSRFKRDGLVIASVGLEYKDDESQGLIILLQVSSDRFTDKDELNYTASFLILHALNAHSGDPLDKKAEKDKEIAEDIRVYKEKNGEFPFVIDY